MNDIEAVMTLAPVIPVLIIDDVDDILDAQPAATRAAAPQPAAETPIARVENVLKARFDGCIDALQLKDRRTVWVLSDDASPAAWKAMLERVLKITDPDKVIVATFKQPIDPKLGG